MLRRLFFAVVLGLALGAGAARAEEEEKHFTWHPGVLITVVGDDNPHLEKDGDATWGAWFQPSLELGWRGEFFDLGGEFGADLRHHQKFVQFQNNLFHIIDNP